MWRLVTAGLIGLGLVYVMAAALPAGANLPSLTPTTWAFLPLVQGNGATPTPTSSSTPTPTATATASPTPEGARLFRFAVIGDYGLAGQPESDVAAIVRSWNPNFIVTTGDNNYYLGEASTIDQNIGQYYHDFIFPYVGSYGPGADVNRFFPAPGNHDWHLLNGLQPFTNYFTLPGNERYYDFVWDGGPVHFFILDSDDHEPDGIDLTSQQALWLRTELRLSKALWQVVVLHHAPYSSSMVHGSNPTLQWPYGEWGADVVLAGHDHLYERLDIKGVPYIVNGLGGMPTIYDFTEVPLPESRVRYNGDWGAQLVDVYANQINFSFITRTQQVIDEFGVFRNTDVDPNDRPPDIVYNGGQ